MAAKGQGWIEYMEGMAGTACFPTCYADLVSPVGLAEYPLISSIGSR